MVLYTQVLHDQYRLTDWLDQSIETQTETDWLRKNKNQLQSLIILGMAYVPVCAYMTINSNEQKYIDLWKEELLKFKFSLCANSKE